jgi:O-acetylhomoserine/O-acetylserine sulfhydrylase
MTTIAIKPIHSTKTVSITKQVSRKSKELYQLPILKDDLSVELVADRIAGILKASSALPLKSSKSATFLLVKNIVKAGENIVTINALNLYKDEVIRERLGVEVKLTEDESLASFKETIDSNTKLVFLESLGIDTHVIPDFHKVIAYAKSRNIPVAIHNTIGFGGTIFNPLAWGADFSIESFPLWYDTRGNLKSILIERKGLPSSLIEKIKSNSIDRPTPHSLPQNLFDKVKELESLPLKSRRVSSVTLSVSNWLKESTHVKEVEYTGLPSHASHFNALKYFSGGYGNIFSFSLWANHRSFDFFLDNLIPRSFQLIKILDINYERKKITIAVASDDLQAVINHFRSSFESLQKYLGSDYFLYENLYDVQDAIGY